MSDSSIQFVELPKFKDKVMYMSSANTLTRLETSYAISASYQGIVRLSPNNHTIYSENPKHQLSLEEERTEGLLQSDAILFDNDVETAMKSNCDITRRMIIASQSTGFLVNFRFSKEDVEFDNLGIIGILKSDNLTLYTTQGSNTDKVFTMNGHRMPTHSTSSRVSTKPLYKYQNEKYTQIDLGDYDVREVEVKGTGDDSCLLYGVADENNERVFKYKKTRLFLRDAIMEALLDLETVPTGSIHYLPVTLDQYKSLCNRGEDVHLPNHSFINDDQSRGTTDPIVRDFLLCDGRKYYNKDFPELAKILWKEYIHTWKPVKGSDNNASKFLQPHDKDSDNQGKSCNDYAQKEQKTFRVPDLRHMFIASIISNPQVSFKGAEPETHPLQKSIITGVYTTDNLPKYSQKYKNDTHKHFVSYGTYDLTLMTRNKHFNSLPNSYINQKTSKRDGRMQKLQAGQAVGSMYLTNHPFFMGDKWHNGFGYRHRDNPQKGHIGVESVNAHFWASIPIYNNAKTTKEDQLSSYQSSVNTMTGGSSIQVPSVGSYNDPNNLGLHGHENAPKFFAMLPLIKI